MGELRHNPPDVTLTMTADKAALASPAAGQPPAELERVLVRRALRGDTGAFRRLFERHGPPVRRFVRDLLGDDTAADEATQETFVRAHGRLSTLRDRDKVLPWLFGIARNVAWELMRARRTHGPLALPPASEEAVDYAPSPEAMLLSREADRHLSAALAELPEERRAALVLRIDHGLGYEQIAAVMGWPLFKVKNEIHRARLTLRVRLTRYMGGVS